MDTDENTKGVPSYATLGSVKHLEEFYITKEL